MLLTDGSARLGLSGASQHVSALPLIFVGLGWICCQPAVSRTWGNVARNTVVGLAFVAWGTEQLIPASRLSAVLDGYVVSVFVVDLGVLAIGSLRAPRRSRDKDSNPR